MDGHVKETDSYHKKMTVYSWRSLEPLQLQWILLERSSIDLGLGSIDTIVCIPFCQPILWDIPKSFVMTHFFQPEKETNNNDVVAGWGSTAPLIAMNLNFTGPGVSILPAVCSPQSEFYPDWYNIILFYFELNLNPYMSVKLHIDTFVEQELADEKATVVII